MWGGGAVKVAVAAVVVTSAAGLYEDQAGVNEWHMENVGVVQEVAFLGQNAVVGSAQGVLAALNAKEGGALAWREVVPEGSGSEVASGGFSYVGAQGKRVLSVSKDGCTARAWYGLGGGLLWDATLCDNAGGSAPTAALFLSADVDSDKLEDVAVMVENRVKVLSGKDGSVVWDFVPQDGVTLEGLTAGSGAAAGTVFAFGRTSSGRVSVAQLNAAKHRADTAEVEGDLGTARSAPVAVGGGSGAPALLAWAAAGQGELVLFDLAERKAKASGQVCAGASSPVSLTADPHFPFVLVGDQVFALSSDLSAKQIASGAGGLVAGGASVPDNEDGAGSVVAIEQAGAGLVGGACGMVSSVLWRVSPSGKEYSLRCPEADGQAGERGAVQRVFVQAASIKATGGSSARVVAVFEDESIVAFQLRVASPQAEPEVQLLYVREEALANVVQVGSTELPPVLEDVDANLTEEIANTLTHGNGFAVFAFRLKDQVRALRSTFSSLLGTARHYLNLVVESRGEILVQAYKGELPSGEQGYSASALSAFGFRKGIVLLTKAGKVFLINALTGSIEFGVFDASLRGSAQLFVTRPHGAGVSHPAEILLVNQATGAATWRNAHTGALLRREAAVGPVLETVFIPGELAHHFEHTAAGKSAAVGGVDEEDLAPAGFVVAVVEGNVWRTFPADKQAWLEEHSDLLKKTHLAHFDAASATLSGMALGRSGRVQEVWTVVVPPGDEVVAVQAHAGGEVNNPGIARGDGSVLVRYINPNLLLLATRNANGDLIVTVLDGVSGRVAKRFSHKQSSGPFHAVLYDNMVVYSYWNQASARNEVAIAALFEGAIGKRELNLWTPRSEDDVGGKSTFSSFDVELPSVNQRTFFTDKAVRAMGVSSTRFGIADRRVFLGVEPGSVNMQIRQLLDARRPMGKPTDEETLEGLVSYFPQLPIVPTFTLSYNRTLARIGAIHSFPTRLESTSLVLTTGLDLFFARVMPSKGFDVLNEDFSFALLILLTSGLGVGAVVLSGMVKERQLSSAWQ